MAPAYTVNRILARIPIMGQILSGCGSDAALAATFSITGPLADPQVSVNPLAALVPGLIRDLFGAFTADTDLARTASTSAAAQAGRTSTWRLRPADSLMWPSRTAPRGRPSRSRRRSARR